jgi:D-alanyl-D-alanine carboxypeptidase/D-alanyl-D-alanine-endopeptidase (penicillin-binding protein 4)
MEFLAPRRRRPAGLALQDGSGLSRSDLVSPHEMVSLLAAMDRHRYAAAFRRACPSPAWTDARAPHEGHARAGTVVAKTGTIRHVNALDGYATSRSGERLAFAVIVNHHTGDPKDVTSAIDQIGNVLVGR